MAKYTISSCKVTNIMCNYLITLFIKDDFNVKNKYFNVFLIRFNCFDENIDNKQAFTCVKHGTYAHAVHYSWLTTCTLPACIFTPPLTYTYVQPYDAPFLHHNLHTYGVRRMLLRFSYAAGYF